jgi:hypothetical protein
LLLRLLLSAFLRWGTLPREHCCIDIEGSVMNSMCRSLRMLPPFLVACALSLPVLADETVAVVPADPGKIKTLDEIIVSGGLGSLGSAWKAVIEAEDRFYARYNELNKDDAMDIECRFEQAIGTRIPKRTCQPRRVDEAGHNEAERLLGKRSGDSRQLKADAIQADLKARTLKLLAEDPELLRALLERTRLEQHYEQLRAEKFKDGKAVGD